MMAETQYFAADDVIANTGALADLDGHVAALAARYRRLAAAE